MEKVEALIFELRRFSSAIIDLGGPANSTLISAFEQDNNVTLPNDYKLVIAQVNGFNLMGSEVYGVLGKAHPSSLEINYHYEHFEVKYPQPAYLVNFSPDGGGNFYCFDTRYQTQEGNSCPIVFWLSNYLYAENDAPEVVYDSFIDFVGEVVIDWTVADYDYEGNER